MLDLVGATDSVNQWLNQWLFHNSVELKADKSEAAMFGTVQTVDDLKSGVSAVVARTLVVLFDNVKRLGVTFESRLSFDKHISSVLLPHAWIAAHLPS